MLHTELELLGLTSDEVADFIYCIEKMQKIYAHSDVYLNAATTLRELNILTYNKSSNGKYGR